MAPFKYGKLAHNIKLKYQQEIDAVITGTIEHRTKPGQIGSLLCAVYGDKDIRFKVGSGLTDAQRMMQPKDLLGHIMKGIFTDITMDSKTKEFSLKNPRIYNIDFTGIEAECRKDDYSRQHH